MRDSYDLIIQLDPWNEKYGHAWGWSGVPMMELGSIQRRLRRLRKEYGARLTAWKIVRMALDAKTGEVAFTIVEQGAA